MCDYYHNRPFPAFKGVSAARLTYPDGIGNISIKSLDTDVLHQSQAEAIKQSSEVSDKTQSEMTSTYL